MWIKETNNFDQSCWNSMDFFNKRLHSSMTFQNPLCKPVCWLTSLYIALLPAANFMGIKSHKICWLHVSTPVASSLWTILQYLVNQDYPLLINPKPAAKKSENGNSSSNCHSLFMSSSNLNGVFCIFLLFVIFLLEIQLSRNSIKIVISQLE